MTSECYHHRQQANYEKCGSENLFRCPHFKCRFPFNTVTKEKPFLPTVFFLARFVQMMLCMYFSVGCSLSQFHSCCLGLLDDFPFFFLCCWMMCTKLSFQKLWIKSSLNYRQRGWTRDTFSLHLYQRESSKKTKLRFNRHTHIHKRSSNISVREMERS